MVVIATQHVVDRKLAHPHTHVAYPAGKQIEHAARPIEINDGDIQNGVQCVAHRIQHKRHTTGLGPQQVLERRGLRVMFGRGEPRAFDKIHHRHRKLAKLLAGASRCRHVRALQLRMAQQRVARIAFHERKIQRPPGHSEQWYPDELTLEEKPQERDTAIEHLLQHGDIHPALVVAQHEVTTVDLQPVQPFNLPRHARESIEQRVVDTNPAFRDHHQHT